MFFALREFAGNEIRGYQVERSTGYSIDNPKGEKEIYIYPMLIYKKTLRVLTPNADGIRESGQLNGKIEKKYNLKLDDTIIVENQKYRVTELSPRLYSDFMEFVLECERDGK